MIDNTTAVAYVKNMGLSHSLAFNCIAHEIWEWALDHSIWLSVSCLPGALNVVADRAELFLLTHSG